VLWGRPLEEAHLSIQADIRSTRPVVCRLP